MLFIKQNFYLEVDLEELVLLSNLFATLLLQTDGSLVMYSSKILFSSWVFWDTICAHTDNKRQHIIPRVLETSLMWTDKSALIRANRTPVQTEIFNYMRFSLVNAFWQTHLICQYLFKMELDIADSINDIKTFFWFVYLFYVSLMNSGSFASVNLGTIFVLHLLFTLLIWDNKTWLLICLGDFYMACIQTRNMIRSVRRWKLAAGSGWSWVIFLLIQTNSKRNLKRGVCKLSSLYTWPLHSSRKRAWISSGENRPAALTVAAAKVSHAEACYFQWSSIPAPACGRMPSWPKLWQGTPSSSS